MIDSKESVALPALKWYTEKSGWKILPGQFASFPYVRHLQFADKKDLLLPNHSNELTSITEYLAASKNKYQQFLRQKNRYPSLDLYACFQPFNEAFKALYPFVDYIKQSLQDGDIIVNLWDRSGWTAHMLAGWFPKQHIITVWEGDKDILGYRGFDYWMSEERQQNHTVVFADFLRPLPFENASVAAVIGFDLLHRFHQPEMLSEILRITKPEAPVIFPHVHLTNNKPEPFFERGCRQLHGNDYQYLFDQMAASTNRNGYVFSEPFLFNWNDHTSEREKPMVSDPANTDYNACVAWLSSKTIAYLKPWRGHEQEQWEAMYLLQNSLLAIDANGTIQLNEKAFQETIHELLERHAVYAKRIQTTIGRSLDKESVIVLYWAMHGLTIGEIMQKIQVDKSMMQQILTNFWNLDLAQAVPVNETGFRLQTLLGQQQYILEKNETHLYAFWQKTVSFYANEPWVKMLGEEAITYEQADELIQLVKKALLAQGLKKGDKIIVCAGMHTELLLLFWAAVSLGIVVVPISAKESANRIQEYVNILNPAFVITDPAIYKSFQQAGCLHIIMTDLVNDEAYVNEKSFQYWLELAMEKENIEHACMPLPDDVAVILWTTGSTGNPKGIPITHAQLIRSGRAMTETYHWKKTDRYFALGGLEAMSGLRHATVSIAEAGACCVISNSNNSIHDHVQNIAEESVTILTANPVFFKQLLAAAKGKLSKKIRLALCTGNQLHPDLREAWQKNTGIALYNYYGLTETTGICIAEPLRFSATHNGSIGLPVDCLVKIIDENGNDVPKGMPGELCIYGAGVFTGYYNNEEATKNSLKDGWFYTKDIAVQHEDGCISLGERLSNIIKLPTGERLELSAIEEAMENVQHIKDWAVCIIPRQEREDVGVFVVLEQGIDYQQLQLHIKQIITAVIGSYALPKIIEPVEFIPRGNHNKILRQQLLDQYFQSIKI